MKILLVSDSHGNNAALDEIALKHPHMDLYLHAGDSQSTSYLITPYTSVAGNCDYYDDFPEHMLLPIPGGNLWIQHYPNIDINLLKENNIKLFLYGHTHRRDFHVLEGITFVNPGAISFERDDYPLSYAIIEIDEKDIKVNFYSLLSLM